MGEMKVIEYMDVTGQTHGVELLKVYNTKSGKLVAKAIVQSKIRGIRLDQWIKTSNRSIQIVGLNRGSYFCKPSLSYYVLEEDKFFTVYG